MPDRTNYDARETPGVEAYRARRRRRLDRMGSEANRRGRTLPGDRPGSMREGQYYSPEEQAEAQDITFSRRGKAAKQHEMNLERARPVESPEANFSTEDAAQALARRRRMKASETVGGRDRYRR